MPPLLCSIVGVLLRNASEVEHHGRLVADDPAIVAGRQGGDVPGAEVELLAVCHDDMQAAGDHVNEMWHVTVLPAPNDGPFVR